MTEVQAAAYTYPSILAGAQGLLCDAVDLVKSTRLEFAVVGGWSPFFLNGDRQISHPGSRDVDLLFRGGAERGALAPVFDALENAGYFHSAKHEFQMLRVLEINGEKFVFNVDLLHAEQAASAPEL